MEETKLIHRFVAGAALVACAYCCCHSLCDMSKAAQAAEIQKPLIYLTGGEVIDPATAPQTTKFDKETAKDVASLMFEDAEEAPDLNEFLSRFLCDTCGKGCLLATPFCFVGQGNREAAVEIYQEMYPEVEL